MSVISITSNALSQIKLLIQKRDKPVLGIRIGIKSGGCNGKTYYIEYADSKSQYDEVVVYNDVNVFIDPKALMYILGTEMDYVNTPFKSGFQFNNPNEKGSCGCGKSFNV